jgi:MraZ protein
MLFLGEYRVNFSGQGRIVIPKKIREALGEVEAFTLTKGFDRCLSGYRNSDWEKGAENLMGPSILEAQKIEMKRHLFSSASSIDIDDQGRIIVPKTLFEYAVLKGEEVVVIGVGSYFEIWSPQRWEEYSRNNEKNIRSYAKTEA